MGYLASKANAGLIDWPKLAEQLRAAPAVPTDQQRIDLLVRMANSQRLTGGQWNQLVGLRVQAGGDELELQTPEELQRFARENLGRMLNEQSGPQGVINAERNLRGAIVLHPEADGVRVIAANIRAALTYAMTKAARSKSVHQCQLHSCGRFFFLPGGPGAPPKCCPDSDCGQRFDKERAVERMRKLRRSRR